MAELIQKNNKAPEPKNGGSAIAAAIFFIAAIISGAVYLFTHSIIALAVGAAALFVCFVALISKAALKNYTPPGKRYGDMGERMAGSILEKYLPDGYTVIQNIRVTFNNKTSEIDNVVIGRTGVYIVEVKFIKGSIIGSYDSKDWLQDKVDQYAIEHQKTFYNPVKQVGTHRYRLANYLRDNKVFTDIKCAVYFANPETSVTLSGTPNDIPVFTYADTQALINYIMSGNENLSEKTINRIIEILK